MVDPNGTMTVAPSSSTTYTITATGSGGTVTANAVLTVTHLITLQITEPLEGAFVSDSAVTVRGIIDHANGLETGLMVNGMPAIIDGGQFTANHVPLIQGENTITATATDTSGLTLSGSIMINADIPEDYIRLSASPVSGTSPFEATLRIDSSFAIASVQVTYFGPDDVTYLDESIDEIRLEVTTKSIHTFAIEAANSDGNVYTDEVSIEVVDRAALDALLQQKWADMKTALISGNIELSLQYHHERSRESYSAIYNALSYDLPTLVPQMQDISWIYYTGGTAKYRIRQNHDINGQILSITYYVYFRRGENGLWFIEKY